MSKNHFQSLLSQNIKCQTHSKKKNIISLNHIAFPDSELLSYDFLPDRLAKELCFFKNQFSAFSIHRCSF